MKETKLTPPCVGHDLESQNEAIKDILKAYKNKRGQIMRAREEERDVRTRIYDMTREQNSIKQEMVQYAPFQVGDKVLAKGAKYNYNITPKHENIEGFVGKVKVFIRNTGDFRYTYDIHAIKKDGKMSQRLIDGYYSKSMEFEQLEKL